MPLAEVAPPAARREMVATLAIVLGLLATLGALAIRRRWAAHPSTEQCLAMLDRYAEQRARANRGDGEKSPDPKPPASAHPAADVARCARELTLAELDCAMRSNNDDELERCLP